VTVSKYDEISVKDFLKEMPDRLDGAVTLAVAAGFLLLAALAPIFGISLGRLHDWGLSVSAICMVPILLLYYASLVYFSVSGAVSVAINTALVVAVPALFLYFI
jgi:uncharacterized membrane protein YhaH (DUF805 family)